MVQAGAAFIVGRLRRVDEIAQAYNALEKAPSIRAEVHLHEGWAESIARKWTPALDHLRAVASETDEAYLRYLGHYLAGRTLQNMGDSAASRIELESALAIRPNARSAATQLAAELLLSERPADRRRASDLLRAANSDSAPDDPWRLFFHGDARLWPTYMAQLRQALQ
jgi:tetratricopeptide (TPR) repeat protein